MAYIPRSSSNNGAIPLQIQKKRTIHVFSLIATIMLIASASAAVGGFLYSNFLEEKLVVAQGELNMVSESEDQKNIEEIHIYDAKLKIASNLLDNHVAASQIFEEIEQATKQTVAFESLEYTYDPGFEAAVTLGGSTEAFTSVALQKMQFYKENIFSEFVVQDITVSNTVSETLPSSSETDVSFSVTGIFKKGVLEYTGESGDVSTTIEEVTSLETSLGSTTEEMAVPGESTSPVEDVIENTP